MRSRNTPGPKQATSSTSPVLVAKAPPEADMPRLPEAERRINSVVSSCIGGPGVLFSLGKIRSAGELRFRHAGHVHAHGEDSARLGQPQQLIRLSQLARGCDIERLQVRATKCAHRRAHCRQRKLRNGLPAGRETHDLAATIERAPVTSLAVDGAAVWAIV